MAAAFAPDVTSLLLRWQNGDDCALASLTPLVYEELHRIAHRFMARERPEHTLETTALVNEAYVRLIDQSRVSWQSRGHFFAVSATLMRRVLVDYARTRLSAKRRGSETHEPLDEACAVSPPRAAILVAVDDALSELTKLDPRKSRIVELRFFGGLTVEETAVALAVSCATVEREWRTARAWLYREIGRNAEA